MRTKTLTIKLKPLTLKPLTYNAGVIHWYERQLKRIVRIMRKATTKGLEEIWKNLKSEIKIDVVQDANPTIEITTFVNNAEDIIDAFLNKETLSISVQLLEKINSISNAQFYSMLRNLETSLDDNTAFMIKGQLIDDYLSEGVQTAIEASLQENVTYIKAIKDRYFTNLKGQVMRFINGGASLTDLKDYVNTLGAKSERHAELIAQDQVRKAFSSINIHRMADAGIKKFKWLHVGGSANPREYHKNVLNGQIFDIENPPVIEPKTGETGYPAQLPYCRCQLIPIVDITD